MNPRLIKLKRDITCFPPRKRIVAETVCLIIETCEVPPYDNRLGVRVKRVIHTALVGTEILKFMIELDEESLEFDEIIP